MPNIQDLKGEIWGEESKFLKNSERTSRWVEVIRYLRGDDHNIFKLVTTHEVEGGREQTCVPDQEVLSASSCTHCFMLTWGTWKNNISSQLPPQPCESAPLEANSPKESVFLTSVSDYFDTQSDLERECSKSLESCRAWLQVPSPTENAGERKALYTGFWLCHHISFLKTGQRQPEQGLKMWSTWGAPRTFCSKHQDREAGRRLILQFRVAQGLTYQSQH